MSNANAVSSSPTVLRLMQSGGPSTSSNGLTSMIDSLCVQNKIWTQIFLTDKRMNENYPVNCFYTFTDFVYS